MLNVWVSGLCIGLAIANAVHGSFGFACFDLALAIPNVFFAARYLVQAKELT